MDYLTVKEVAELKGCSGSYISRSIKNGKLEYKTEINPANNQKIYLIPVSALPEDLQAKYYKQQRTETGLLPEMLETEKADKTRFKYGLKGNKRPFESFSKEEREVIKFWTNLLREWQSERSRRKDKAEFDKLFVAHQKYLNPDLSISVPILYRKYEALQNEYFEDLLDNRNKWKRGTSKLDKNDVIWQSFLQLYLDQRKPKISLCYREMMAFITEEYPELAEQIPNEACFRRKIKTLPFAVMEYAREGQKAFHDHCTPYANRDKSNIFANDVWVMDNYTFDVIVKEEISSKTTKRMYLTTVLDVKSGVLVGWNITESPDSQSTIDALRFAMLRFGIPKQLYFDNGREFTTLDIAGDKRNRKVAQDKKGNLPVTIIEKLDIKIIFALVTNAQAKVVERIHRIIKEQFCTSQDGYCGGNILERPENLKIKVKNGNVETEMQLRNAFAEYADSVLNVAEYGGDEAKYKGMTAIEVWNKSASETEIRQADESVLNLLMLRNNGFQTVQRDGVYINYHGGKIWYYDEKTTWKYLKQKVCVRYDGNDPSSVRLYDTDDRYLCTWQCADWLITEYFNENRDNLAELGRKKASVIKQVKGRISELKGKRIRITRQTGIRYIAKKNAGKFNIQMPKNIIPVAVGEPLPQAVGAENIEVKIDIRKMIENAKKRRGE